MIPLKSEAEHNSRSIDALEQEVCYDTQSEVTDVTFQKKDKKFPENESSLKVCFDWFECLLVFCLTPAEYYIMQTFLRDLLEAMQTIWFLVVRVYESITWAKIWEILLLRLPIVDWLPKYSVGKLSKDLQVKFKWIRNFRIQPFRSKIFSIIPSPQHVTSVMQYFIKRISLAGGFGCWLYACSPIHGLCRRRRPSG